MNTTLKFEGNIVNLDNLFDPLSYLEVREVKTNHLLGYLRLPRHIIQNPTVRIDLYSEFDFEDNFSTCVITQYREFQVRTAFNHRGQSMFKYLEADFNDWKDIVKNRKDEFASELITVNGVDYIMLTSTLL